VSHAFHSPLMDPVLGEFERVAGGVRYGEPRIGVVSNVTGRVAGAAELCRPGYWREHLREAVRFADGIRAAAEHGCDIFLELGPDPTLVAMGQRCVAEPERAAWLASLRPGRDDWRQVSEALAALYVRGVAVDWAGYDRPYARRKVDLPTYPFQRERYWLQPPAQRPRASKPGTGHPVLGTRLDLATVEGAVFESHLSLESLPYLADHRIHDLLVLPSPAYVEAALAAAGEWFGGGEYEVEDLVIVEPVVVPEEGACVMQTVVEPDGRGVRVRFFGRGEDGWREVASARILRAGGAPGEAPAEDGLSGAWARCNRPLDVDVFYGRIERLGLRFGPRFRATTRLVVGVGEVLGELALPAGLRGGTGGYRFIHPALLDSCLHLIGAALPAGGAELQEPFILMGLDRLRFFERPGEEFWAHVRLQPAPGGGAIELREAFAADLRLYASDGRLLGVAEGLRLRRAPREAVVRSAADRVPELLYEVAWPVVERAASEGDRGDVASIPVLAAPAEIAARILPGVAALSAANGMDAYDRMMPGLDAAAAGCIADALQALGWQFEPGSVVTAESVAARCGIIDRHRRLLDRMLAILEEDGVLRREGAGWRVERRPAPAGPDGRWAALRAQFPEFATELDLVARCTGGLAEVLCGKADPLELLFPAGSLEDAGKLYRDTPSARTYNALVRDAIAAAIRNLPAHRKIRVLEIGAGTGGTTAHVLPVLPADRTEYTFTDVSTHFLRSARAEFGAYPFVRYELLDISRDPSAQGFEPGAYDIVIAANVLHATPELRTTVRHVAELLAPGGLLVLFEVLVRQRFADLTVGLTEGWWSFTDHDLRPDYTVLSRQDWRRVLVGAGFDAVEAVPGADAKGMLGTQAVFLARRAAGSAAADRGAEVASTAVAGQAAWLVFADRGGVGDALAAELRGRGERCVVVGAGSGYERSGADQAVIDPADPAHVIRLLEDVGGVPRGVVHLWALDEALPADGAGGAELMGACRRAAGSVLHLVQGLARTGSAEPPSLWLVTRGAQATGDPGLPPPEPVQAAVWGLGHTIAIEHPELRCVRLDLDPVASAEVAAAQLAAEIRAPDGEDEVALRNGVRRVRRLVRAADRADRIEPVRFDPEGTYLITGGLRGLGPVVAEWLVERGARHLVLMGRSAPPDTTREALARIERAGGRVLVARGDVSRREDVERILAEARASMPPLRGIFHSAGVLDDGTLLQQNWTRFETVLAPKVLGAWHLHVLTRGEPLDHFVLFSSGAGLLGTGGQANHAAANAFLDVLAHHRRALGLPAVTINWGAWADVGAAVERQLDERMKTFTPEEGLRALERALYRAARSVGPAAGQLAVFAVDWSETFQDTAGYRARPVFRELLRESERTPRAAAAKPTEPGLLEQLAAELPGRRVRVLAAHIRRIAAGVLGMSDPSAINAQQPLQELGLDSLMAVELRNKLGQAVGRTLPATLLFEYPSIAALTDYLAAEVLPAFEADGDCDAAPATATGSADQEGDPAAAPESGVAPDLEGLDEEQLAALLLAKLDELDAQSGALRRLMTLNRGNR